MTDAPRTPLTLEFKPDNLENGKGDALVICEPSFSESGRIFLGAVPLSERVGVHLLPEEARRVRDHLNKLLMDGNDTGALTGDEPPEGAETPEQRLARAVERAAERAQEAGNSAPAARKPLVERLGRWGDFKREFRFEFQIGRFQGVIGSTPRD